MCFSLCLCRSANSVSLSLRSASPSASAKHQLLPKQQNPVSSSQPFNLTVTVDNNESTSASSIKAKPASDAKSTKRKSLDDAAVLQENFTQSSIKHDLRQVYHAISQL